MSCSARRPCRSRENHHRLRRRNTAPHHHNSGPPRHRQSRLRPDEWQPTGRCNPCRLPRTRSERNMRPPRQIRHALRRHHRHHDTRCWRPPRPHHHRNHYPHYHTSPRRVSHHPDSETHLRHKRLSHCRTRPATRSGTGPLPEHHSRPVNHHSHCRNHHKHRHHTGRAERRLRCCQSPTHYTHLDTGHQNSTAGLHMPSLHRHCHHSRRQCRYRSL